MTFAGQITALEPRDVKRYPVDVASIPNRGPAASDTSRALSFSEVAAKIADEQARDLEANPPTTPAKPAKHFALWEQEEFGFRDIVDIINPLQHIPIVATLYRNMTGEKIGAVARVVGGALWGRLGGFVSGLVNVVVDWFTGKDIGDHIYSALFGQPSESDHRHGPCLKRVSIGRRSIGLAHFGHCVDCHPAPRDFATRPADQDVAVLVVPSFHPTDRRRRMRS